MRKNIFIVLLMAYASTTNLFAQSSTNVDYLGKDDANTITTATPFLMIAPDSRSSAMGDAGVAISPDANSMHWNPSKYAFIKDDMGFSLSYTPWLKELVDDISLMYLSGFYRLDSRQAIAFSLRYFSLGTIIFTNNNADVTGNFNPNEFGVDAAYAFKMHKNLSGGIAVRYIHSNLTGGQYVGSSASSAGNAFAADLSFYYTKDLKLEGRDANMSFGVNASNIGTKISYTDDAVQNFLPINLRVGGAFTFDIDDYNAVTFTTDLNKLMVPTTPYYDPEQPGKKVILYGRDPDVSVASGIFGSFSDAPGIYVGDGNERNVMKEELQEIYYAFGAEYLYNQRFAVRGGYFHEHEQKGNRKYFTFGFGLRLNVFGLDFSYLIPTQGQNNPLKNTLRFSLSFNIDGLRQATSESTIDTPE